MKEIANIPRFESCSGFPESSLSNLTKSLAENADNEQFVELHRTFADSLKKTLQGVALRFTPLVLGAGAIAFGPACGSEGEVSENHVDGSPTQPVATKQIETPTEIPTLEPTPTQEPFPSQEEIAALIRKGFEGFQPTVEQIPDTDFRDVNIILEHLSFCDDSMEPFTPYDSPVEFNPQTNEEMYKARVLGECEEVGNASRDLYQVTSKNGLPVQADAFLETNKLERLRHKFLAEEFGFGGSYWKAVEERTYSISLAQ